MVIAPSDSLANISEAVMQIAVTRLTQLGLEVVIAPHARELDGFDSSSVEARVADMHAAFMDQSIQGIFTAFGGYNANQLLPYLDWNLIAQNPKIFIGFSDTTVLQNAIYAKTGLVTYSGPSFARFGQELHFEYTLEHFKKCVCTDGSFHITPSTSWSDDWWASDQTSRVLEPSTGWVTINEGTARGIVLGGNLSTFNLLQGTPYFPNITNTVLFLEDDSESTLAHFDRDLESLSQTPAFVTVQAIVVGRFQKGSRVNIDQLEQILTQKQVLKNIPIIANVDFGHTDPICTFPIGGEVAIQATPSHISIEVITH